MEKAQDTKEMAEKNYERYCEMSKRVLEFFVEEAKEKKRKKEEARKNNYKNKDPNKEARSDLGIEQSAHGEILRL